MKTKDEIYNKKIHPLMAQIVQICRDNEIPVFATFECTDDKSFYSTSIYDHNHPVFGYYEALRQCLMENAVNMDKFLFWLMEKARKEGHSSILLSKLLRD